MDDGGGDDDDDVDKANASAFGALLASESTIFFGESQRSASVSNCGWGKWNESIGDPSRISNLGNS